MLVCLDFWYFFCLKAYLNLANNLGFQMDGL